MTLILGYVHQNNIVIISDGRQSTYTNNELKVLNDDEKKLIIHDNQYVFGHLGISSIILDKETLINTKEITRHFIQSNEKNFLQFRDIDVSILARYLVETWNNTFLNSFKRDPSEFKSRFSFVVAKWTKGIPQLITYDSHDLNTKKFIGKFSYWDNIISGNIVNYDALLPYRDIKLDELPLAEGIETMLNLYKDIEAESPAIGGLKQVYILNENPDKSYWYKK